MIERGAWRSFESDVYRAIMAKFPGARARFNAKLPGYLSDVPRQIDVLVELDGPGEPIRIAVEAKHHVRPIDVKGVEEFIGLLHDVRVERGVMLSSSGYTKTAFQRAFADDVDLDLDIFSLAEFIGWQNHGGIPFAGFHAAIVDAPLGWVLEPYPPEGMLAALHRRGISLDEAAEQREFIYVNIWDRSEMPNLDALLERQGEDLRRWCPDVEIRMNAISVRTDFQTRTRRAYTPGQSVVEITGFIEFPRFILFAVLHTPLLVELRNLRKLEYILQTAIPGEVVYGQMVD
jgi:hypothetical protein